MTENMTIVHNACLEYKKGMPYAVYTYAIADFDVPYVPTFHLYAAFLDNGTGIRRSEEGFGESVKKFIKPEKEEQVMINEILNDEKLYNRQVSPREIYEGTDLSEYTLLKHTGIMRLKDHMPIPFDGNEVRFEIARYDTLYNNLLTSSSLPEETRNRISGKFSDLEEAELKKYNDRDCFKSTYKSLQMIIDNWLDGKIYIKNLKHFLIDADFEPTNKDKDMTVSREINIYVQNVSAVLRSEKYATMFGELGYIPEHGLRYCICNYCDNDPSNKKKLNYYVDNKDYLAKWLVNYVKGTDEKELEQKMPIKIQRDDMNLYLYQYLEDLGFKLYAAPIECIDPVNDQLGVNEMPKIVIPYKALRRFRETGQ
nr:hypothetical protein [Lachnospiraceae bacterium]